MSNYKQCFHFVATDIFSRVAAVYTIPQFRAGTKIHGSLQMRALMINQSTAANVPTPSLRPPSRNLLPTHENITRASPGSI
jgi:hypothetical protein